MCPVLFGREYLEWRLHPGGGDKTFLTVLLDTPLGEQPTGNSWLLPPDLHTIRLGEQPTGNSLLLPPDLHTINLGEQPAGNS